MTRGGLNYGINMLYQAIKDLEKEEVQILWKNPWSPDESQRRFREKDASLEVFKLWSSKEELF